MKISYIKLTLLSLISILAGATQSFGQIIMAIDPILNDATKYQLTISGIADTSTTTDEMGSLFFDGAPFLMDNGAVSPGLTFGGSGVTEATPAFIAEYYFYLDSNVTGGIAYSFDGGPIAVSLADGISYENTFNPGTYNITGSNIIFGSNTTGTLTISAVPEPSTYALFASLLILGITVYRRSKK